MSSRQSLVPNRTRLMSSRRSPVLNRTRLMSSRRSPVHNRMRLMPKLPVLVATALNIGGGHAMQPPDLMTQESIRQRPVHRLPEAPGVVLERAGAPRAQERYHMSGHQEPPPPPPSPFSRATPPVRAPHATAGTVEFGGSFFLVGHERLVRRAVEGRGTVAQRKAPMAMSLKTFVF